jgi:hypothetical protein
MEYTLIGSPLFGDHGQYFAEMTIKKLLQDHRNGWTLEVVGHTEEHFCVPYYDGDGSLVCFDELPFIYPYPQLGLFEEATLQWGVVGIAYEDERYAFNQHKWTQSIPRKNVTFIFRRRDNNVLIRTWIFHEARLNNVDYDSIDEHVLMEFDFGQFESM